MIDKDMELQRGREFSEVTQLFLVDGEILCLCFQCTFTNLATCIGHLLYVGHCSKGSTCINPLNFLITVLGRFCYNHTIYIGGGCNTCDEYAPGHIPTMDLGSESHLWDLFFFTAT